MRENMQFKWSQKKTLLTYISAMLINHIIFCHFEISALEYTITLPTLVNEVGFCYCASSKIYRQPCQYIKMSKSCVK